MGEVEATRIGEGATKALRDELRAERSGWLEEPAEDVAEKFQKGEIDHHTATPRQGAICDWDTNTLLPRSTAQFREAAKDDDCLTVIASRQRARPLGEPDLK